MISLPKELFRHILSFRDPNYELARRSGVPSARWGRYYLILGPTIEYEMVNGRVVSAEWGRPVYSIHGYEMNMVLTPWQAAFMPYIRGMPTQASF